MCADHLHVATVDDRAIDGKGAGRKKSPLGLSPIGSRPGLPDHAGSGACLI